MSLTAEPICSVVHAVSVSMSDSKVPCTCSCLSQRVDRAAPAPEPVDVDAGASSLETPGRRSRLGGQLHGSTIPAVRRRDPSHRSAPHAVRPTIAPTKRAWRPRSSSTRTRRRRCLGGRGAPRARRTGSRRSDAEDRSIPRARGDHRAEAQRTRLPAVLRGLREEESSQRSVEHRHPCVDLIERPRGLRGGIPYPAPGPTCRRRRGWTRTRASHDFPRRRPPGRNERAIDPAKVSGPQQTQDTRASGRCAEREVR